MNNNFDNNNDFGGFDGIHVETPEETAARISRRQLEGLTGNLHEREQAILQALGDCRYMTTGQISQIHFGGAATDGAAARAANRAVHRLEDHGLISSLNRRIGGARAGSSSYVWSLTNPGLRFLNLDGEGKQPRKRNYEPSPHFLNHTLSITELNIQLLGMAGVTVMDIQFEPNCWRSFTGKDGARQQLKPDLYAVTSDGEYEDYWFFELDLATEAPSRVLSKCEQYQDYYRSGMEQSDLGLFPMVVWIVPDDKRKDSIQSQIRQSVNLTNKEIFLVILPDELEPLIRKGAGQ